MEKLNEKNRIGEVILEMKGISKDFPGVKALSGVDFELRRGEVHVLLGENGAGKSTLIKVLSGAYKPDGGTIKLKGEFVKAESPMHMQKLGVSVVYQEFNLIPYLTVKENIFLGAELKKNGFLALQEMYDESKKILEKVGAKLDPEAVVNTLGVAEQQMVEISKALKANADILVLDEPSAVLTDEEIDKFFNIINILTENGTAIIYISHRLEEINRIGDRATVLRDGEYIDTVDIGDEGLDMDQIIQLMVGRKIEQKSYVEKDYIGEEVLRLENISQKGTLDNVNLNLRKGEILAIAGLVGAGRTELAKAIMGAPPIDKGVIYYKGEKVNIRAPRTAIGLGIALAPEDRKKEGLFLELPVVENIVISNFKYVSKAGILITKKIRESAMTQVQNMAIKTPSLEQKVKNLSGGNQQKVVLGRWLASKAEILILDEPTRGIDVGAKQEIYKLMEELAQSGVSIIMISSELPEVLRMGDRILVMHEGQIQGEVDRKTATQEKILYLASGGKM